MKRRTFLGGTVAASTVVAAPAVVSAQAAWPNRPVQVIVPWGAGGGTDYHARTMATLLEREFRNPFTVVQRTGGSGVVGHSAIAEAAPDGYTIGTVTVEIGMMHWAGLTKLTVADYAPISLLNLIPAGVQVAANSPWRTLKDMVDAVRANPGRHKSSGTGQGGIWHLAIAGLLNSMQIRPDAAPWVPSEGAASGLQDLVAGGVDIVPCAIAEASTLLRAGRVRSLAVMTASRVPAFPDVPTVKEAVGSDWTCESFLSLMAPKGTPADVVARLDAAVKKIMEGPEWKQAMDARGFGVNYMGAGQLQAFATRSNEAFGGVMRALGIART
ncbi:MAG: tripartite tricarboxylate transporter substrate binding protein [Alphaproteobacteria bacterium]|nr:tripartite tricarboxylate transporter substrate binding protein [Alphaproteobacteria bacterium]TAD89742.1 MAG: tripartite tricarboxylate transporter substrate binding protein [Alphaproteobacteria bacterium]